MLVHSSLSFYIRENLLDFGLDDLHPPVAKVTFQVGDDDPGEIVSHSTVTADPLFNFTGGFGDIQLKKTPKSQKPIGKFGNFNPKVKLENFPNFEEVEHQNEMRMVVCS